MINKKQILAPLFTFALAAGLFTATAFAEETPEPAQTPAEGAHIAATVDEAVICVGDPVKVTIGSKDMKAITVTGGIKFDKETFECIEIKEADAADLDVVSKKEQAVAAGTVGFAKVGTEEAEFKTADFVTVTFKAAQKTDDAKITLYEDTDDGSDTAYQNDTVDTLTIKVQDASVKEEAKTNLSEAVKDAESVKNDDGTYTEESYKALTDAIADAKKVSEDPNATTAQINAANKAVADAKAGLKENTEKKDASKTLSDTLADAKKVTNADGTYTADSYKALTDAIAAAEKVAADPKATAEQIAAANKAVAGAKAGLKKAAADEKSKSGSTAKPGGTASGDKTAGTTAQTVKVANIKITGISRKIAAGKKIRLNAEITPKDAANKQVTWTSSNKKWATVNAKGVVTTKKAGKGKTVTITATAKDGSKKKQIYKIKIMKGVVKKVSIKGKTTRTVKAGKKLKLKAAVKATRGANKALKWISGNPKYAKVNAKGRVTALKAGKGKTVKITVMATDGSNKKKVVKIKIK